MEKAGGDIMDIADTPDVAVWARGARKGAPSGTVKEPSKIASLTLHVRGAESQVDPADKKQVAKAQKNTLTDDSGYGGQ